MRFHVSLILSFCAISSTLYAQHSLFTDTIIINEIVVHGNYPGSINSGYRKYEVDSAALSEKKVSTLSEILSETIPVYLKNYSPGGLSSISLRGTTAVHSQVLWNGLNLSSPMLGQSDFSLIPAGFIDELSIEYGNASIIKGNGTFGGLININTKPDWNNKYDFSLTGNAGSYGLLSERLKASAGTSKFKSVTRAFLETADNNFKYINDVSDAEPVVELLKTIDSYIPVPKRDLDKLTRKELLAIAKVHGIKNRNKMKKAELIKAIQKSKKPMAE